MVMGLSDLEVFGAAFGGQSVEGVLMFSMLGTATRDSSVDCIPHPTSRICICTWFLLLSRRD